MTPHRCHAEDCDVRTAPKMLMCRRHWAMVPREDQRLVWALYRDGQEITKDPSREYMRETRRIIAELAAREAAAKPATLF